jgi:GntR family transcriptional regulator
VASGNQAPSGRPLIVYTMAVRGQGGMRSDRAGALGDAVSAPKPDSGEARGHPRDGPKEAQYQQIERWLRQRVQQLSPGDPVPTELQLAEQFGVSRMTARQAVQNVAAEGLVRRRRGQGTFVSPRPVHRRVGSLMSFTEDMRRRGMSASSVLLEASLRPATVADMEALRLDQGARTVVIRRLRLADATPMALEHAVLPLECAPVLAEDLESSLHEALINLGRVPSLANSWISARVATKLEAQLLRVPVRSPLIVERRVVYDGAGAPLEHTETRYVAERYVIDAVFTMYSEHAKLGQASGVGNP